MIYAKVKVFESDGTTPLTEFFPTALELDRNLSEELSSFSFELREPRLSDHLTYFMPAGAFNIVEILRYG